MYQFLFLVLHVLFLFCCFLTTEERKCNFEDLRAYKYLLFYRKHEYDLLEKAYKDLARVERKEIHLRFKNLVWLRYKKAQLNAKQFELQFKQLRLDLRGIENKDSYEADKKKNTEIQLQLTRYDELIMKEQENLQKERENRIKEAEWKCFHARAIYKNVSTISSVDTKVKDSRKHNEQLRDALNLYINFCSLVEKEYTELDYESFQDPLKKSKDVKFS